jgi:hypothetical protein
MPPVVDAPANRRLARTLLSTLISDNAAGVQPPDGTDNPEESQGGRCKETLARVACGEARPASPLPPGSREWVV